MIRADRLKEMAMRRSPMLLAPLLVVGSVVTVACSDSGGPNDSTKPPGELKVLRLAGTSPPLFNPVDSFYAKKGEDRELRIFFQNEVGGAGEEYLRLRIDAPTLLARPDGTLFGVGDSVLVTVRIVDPSQILFELEPSGLSFNPADPAELKIRYEEAGGDLDEDGDVDLEDSEIELQLAIWRQETLGGVFERLGSLLVVELDEIEAELLGFSRYAIAY